MGSFCGIRGSDDFPLQSDGVTPLLRKYDWREVELFLRPNGYAMLTALMGMIGSEQARDPRFIWIEREYQYRAGAVTALYDDIGMTTAYTDAEDSAGFVVYANVAAETAKRFVAKDTVVLADKEDYRHNTVAQVLDVLVNGDNSVLTLRLLEDSNGHDGVYLGAVDYIFCTGNAHPEGDVLPDSRVEDPTEVENFTQIFMRSAQMTRTAASIAGSVTRYQEGMTRGKGQAQKQLMEDYENALLFGIKRSSTGSNGEIQRETDGIFSMITKRNTALSDADNPLVDSYKSTGLISGASSWLAGGKWWLDYHMMKASEWGEGGNDLLCLLGNGAMMGVQQLVEEHGDYKIGETTKIFGFKVTKLQNVFATLNLVIHPAFNHNLALNRTMLWIDPKDLKWRDLLKPTWVGPSDASKRMKLMENGFQYVDAIKGGFVGESGVEFHHVRKARVLHDVGLNKTS